MSPEHDDPTEEQELYEEVPPRSIFAATWFRVVLIVIVLGVFGAVAVPYVLDWMNPPVARAPVTAKSSSSSATTPTPAPPTEKPAPPTEKKDTTLIPAPVMPSAPAVTPAAPPARPQPKSESKSAPTTARPVETKPTPPKTEARSAPSTESKSAMAATEKPKPDVAAKPESPANTDTAAKVDTVTKPSSAATDKAQPATTAKSTTTTERAVAMATTPPAAASRPFWVQVGAFRDAETAKRVAAKLREENFKVEESVTRAGGTAPARSAPTPAAAKPPGADVAVDQYDVYITGQTPDELNKRLMGKGLAVEASGAGVVVRPSLPLRDAVALSKDLAVEGLKVQVKRAAGASPPSPAAAPNASAPTESTGLHRVRVGAFPDRETAQAALRELEAKGYKPYIARGAE